MSFLRSFFLLTLLGLILMTGDENYAIAFTIISSPLLNSQSRHRPSSLLYVATTRGMGMGSSKKKGSNKKSRKTSSSFDVNASLLRLEKRYDELTSAAAKRLYRDDGGDADVVTTEYVVAVRAAPTIQDWVPIAQLCVVRTVSSVLNEEGVTDQAVRAAVSHYCRELSLTAALGSRVFQSIPRNSMQYAIESADSFHRHVYEPAVEGSNEDATNDGVMTKQEARRVLNVDADCNSNSEIRRVYRKLSFECHPDRFAGMKRTEAEMQKGKEQYARIQLAYQTLASGLREGCNSWYASLGGRSRTDFVGPIDLLPLKTAEEIVKANLVDSAIVGIEPDLVQSFVARSRQ